MYTNQTRSVLLASLLLGCLGFPCAVDAEDWPVWRGPRNDGTCLEKDVPKEWDVAKVEGDPDRLGLNGSPTQVSRVFPPPRSEKGMMLEGETTDMVKQLVDHLLKENLL